MASIRSISTPSKTLELYNGIVGSGVVSRTAASSWPLKQSKSASSNRFCKCMALPTVAPMAMPLIRENDSLLKYLQQPVVLPAEVDDSAKMEELRQITQRVLQRTSNPSETLNMIDILQRLGIGYHFDNEINAYLERLSKGLPEEDLFTAGLRFRLLRQNGCRISPADVFQQFVDQDGKFKESLSSDATGMLSLYEASQLGANGEEILSRAQEFAETHIRNSLPLMGQKLRGQLLQALDLPRHMRMARLESRRYIDQYSRESDHNPAILELAKLDYNRVQTLHQMELAEITRWWKHLGLVDKLSFARDRPLECFLWTVGILPEPKYSGCRIELAKTIAILLVIDDIFDTHGSPNELSLFTSAIQRWDLNAIEQLPEYMKICYMALYNTTNEIAYKVLREHGLSVLPYLKRTWIDMIEGFQLEANWYNSGQVPNLEEYIENGVTTAGAYMAMVHIFFLIGQGVTDENVKLLIDPYPKLFSCSGRILRLWDDLGTAEEEQERGDLASSIQLFMKENNIASNEEGRSRVLQLIQGLWKELNGELIADNGFPLPLIKANLNMARSSQVVYQHNEKSYFSSVDNYVQALFFTPVDS